DGIRDLIVTGVQTCALPISANDNSDFRVRIVAEFQSTATGAGVTNYVAANTGSTYGQAGTCWYDMVTFTGDAATNISSLSVLTRSEERRVGKECRARWWGQ